MTKKCNEVMAEARSWSGAEFSTLLLMNRPARQSIRSAGWRLLEFAKGLWSDAM